MKMKKTVALLLSLMLTASVFAACDKEKTKEKKISKTTEEETEEETTAGESTTTEETTETSASEIHIAHLSDYDDLTPDEVYEKYRAFATELEQKNNEAGFYYGFYAHFQDRKQIWILAVSNGVSDFGYYTSINGEMIDVTEELGWDMPEKGIFSFKLFMRFPCILELRFTEIDEFAESLDDGVYYGNILAVSENVDKMMVEVWEPVQFTPEEYSALKVGDIVYEDEYSELSVESIDDDRNVILSNPDMFIVKDKSSEGNGNYILTCLGYSVGDHHMLALVSVDPNCKIEDHYSWVYSEIEGYEDYLNDNPDLTAVEKTPFWYGSRRHASFFLPLGNGWEENSSSLNPVFIENNTIVEVRFG